MEDTASCAPSIPVCSTIRTKASVKFCFCALFITDKNLIGSNSNAPGIVPNNAAKLRSSNEAPSSLARSLASPAPADTANVTPAKGFIIDVPASPKKEPVASLTLRGILFCNVDPRLKSAGT